MLSTCNPTMLVTRNKGSQQRSQRKISLAKLRKIKRTTEKRSNIGETGPKISTKSSQSHSSKVERIKAPKPQANQRMYLEALSHLMPR